MTITALPGGSSAIRALMPILVVAVVMVGVGLLAVIGPARRGMRIHPSEALREG